MPDTMIGQLTDGASAVLSFPFRTSGVTVIGQTGMGKTSLLRQLVYQDIVDGTAAIVIDPHGDLVEDLLGTIPDNRVQDVFVLEVDPAHPFGLNLYQKDTGMETDLIVDQVTEVFKKLWGVDQWVHIEYLLRNTARTALAGDRPTMADIPRLFSDVDFRRSLVRRLNRPMVQAFWDEYESMRPYERASFRTPLMNKVDRFLSPEFLSRVFTSPTTTVNLQEIMDNGQVLLARFPVGTVGEEAGKILGSVFLQLIFREALKRENQANRPRVHVYLDEYGRFATPTTSGLLKQARKYAIGTTIAFQTLSDLDDEENRAAALQVANLVLFQVIGRDAHELVQNLKVEPEEETVGLVEKRVISSSVADHLLREGHELDLSKQLDRWVRPLSESLQRNFEVPYLTEVFPFSGNDIRVLCSRQTVSRALSLLDRYFVAMQQGACTDTQEIEYLEQLTVLLGPLIGYLGQGYYQRSYHIPGGNSGWVGHRTWIEAQNFPEQFVECPLTTEERTWIHEMVTLFVAGWHITITLAEGNKPIILAVGVDDPAIHAYQDMRHAIKKRCPLAKERTGYVKQGGWAADPRGDEYLVINKAMTFPSVFSGEEAADRINIFLWEIKAIAEAVRLKPVLTGSGQFEEVKRFKPIADAQNKLEVELATLPRYHAYVQLETSGEPIEGMMVTRTIEWSKPDRGVIEAIREQSRRRFALPNVEAEEHVFADEPPPAEGPSGLRRRKRVD